MGKTWVRQGCFWAKQGLWIVGISGIGAQLPYGLTREKSLSNEVFTLIENEAKLCQMLNIGRFRMAKRHDPTTTEWLGRPVAPNKKASQSRDGEAFYQMAYKPGSVRP